MPSYNVTENDYQQDLIVLELIYTVIFSIDGGTDFFFFSPVTEINSLRGILSTITDIIFCGAAMDVGA